jgi:hypothetical protein
LPLPVQKDWISILPYVRQLKALNWFGLKVTGLAKSTYTLLIDGKGVGAWSAANWASFARNPGLSSTS